MDNKELIDAAKIIKKNCRLKRDGRCYYNQCPFMEGGRCMFAGNPPAQWIFSKKNCFTDEDISLAKALKAFGFIEITRIANLTYCISYRKIPKEILPVPSDSFLSVREGETISIDDIIKEKYE